MESWLWQLGRDEGEARGRAEGEAQGRAEGEVQAVRRICVDLSRECHPHVAARVLPAIKACVQPETLRAWVLQCPKLSDAEFVALVTGLPPKRVTRSRTSRPSRTSHRSGPARKRR